MKRARIILLSLLFLVYGCGSITPDREISLTDFYISSDDITSAGSNEKTETENFAKKNFPLNCEWRKFIRVVDGDTVVIDKNTKVRVLGIDTPETVHPRKPIEKCGMEASLFAKEFFSGAQKICIIYDDLADKSDHYGRVLAHLFNEEGGDFAREILEAGLANAYLSFPFSRKAEYKRYEELAKKNKGCLFR